MRKCGRSPVRYTSDPLDFFAHDGPPFAFLSAGRSDTCVVLSSRVMSYARSARFCFTRYSIPPPKPTAAANVCRRVAAVRLRLPVKRIDGRIVFFLLSIRLHRRTGNGPERDGLRGRKWYQRFASSERAGEREYTSWPNIPTPHCLTYHLRASEGSLDVTTYSSSSATHTHCCCSTQFSTTSAVVPPLNVAIRQRCSLHTEGDS